MDRHVPKSNSAAVASGHRNPFDLVYMTEMAKDNPTRFVQLFSPAIIAGESGKLFVEGNTVLLGTPGVGKTMLLFLFLPAVQLEYDLAGRKNPLIDARYADVIGNFGVRIDVSREGLQVLGSRVYRTMGSDVRSEGVLLGAWVRAMGDVLACLVMLHVIRTRSKLVTRSQGSDEAVGIRLHEDNWNRFARDVATHRTWNDALDGCRNIEDIEQALRARLKRYARAINSQELEVPPALGATDVEAGAGVLAVARALGDAAVIGEGKSLIVCVDQTDHLLPVHPVTKALDQLSLLTPLNEAMAIRDQRVWYKVAWRPYVWRRAMGVSGGERVVDTRNFVTVDLDNMFRGGENIDHGLFADFAEDMANRRLRIECERRGETPWNDRWGIRKRFARRTIEDVEHALGMRGAHSWENLKWPAAPPRSEAATLLEEWKSTLRPEWDRAPTDVLLCVTWLNQQYAKGDAIPSVPSSCALPRGRQFGRDRNGVPLHWKTMPWEEREWRKNRIAAVRCRAAAKFGQRMVYVGWPDIVEAAGESTVLLLTLLRRAWDYHSRDSGGQVEWKDTISSKAVTYALRTQARDSIEGISSSVDRGTDRSLFVEAFGRAAKAAMLMDHAIRYPGTTGFAVREKELDSSTAIRDFLELAASYGDLRRDHQSPKRVSDSQGIAWYLPPLYCVYYDLPMARRNQPYYATCKELASWLATGKAVLRLPLREDTRQQRLFDDELE